MNTAESLKSKTVSKEKSRKSRRVLDHTRIKEADNGGFIVNHEFSRKGGNSSGPEMPYDSSDLREEHVFKHGHEMMDHLAKKFGVKGKSETAPKKEGEHKESKTLKKVDKKVKSEQKADSEEEA